MKNAFLISAFCVLGAISSTGNAQVENSFQEVNKDDLGEVSDAFQEHFFEALKQKAIENYEKALAELKECQKLQPDKAVVYFELGQTYLKLKKTEEAISSFQQSNRLEPNRQWTLVALLNAYYANKNYEDAILVAKKLVEFDTSYNDYLAKIYLETRKYDELLSLLDQLDAKLGINQYRNGLRQEVYALTHNPEGEIETLKQAIEADPGLEKNYLKLIFLYSDQGMEDKAFEAAKEMKTKFPTSKVVDLALYKFYLEDGNMEEALKSIKTVLKAEEIDTNSKFKLINDFLMFVNQHPQYENELKQIAAIFSEQENAPGVFQKLGEYYSSKNEKEQALKYFELGLQNNSDYQLYQQTLMLELELGKNQKTVELSKKALEIFPAQAQLYLYQGTALNKLQQYKEAEDILTFGLDYLPADNSMGQEFYIQLAEASRGLGNEKKAAEYEKKQKEFSKNED